jgi:hypothetical protein
MRLTPRSPGGIARICISSSLPTAGGLGSPNSTTSIRALSTVRPPSSARWPLGSSSSTSSTSGTAGRIHAPSGRNGSTRPPRWGSFRAGRCRIGGGEWFRISMVAAGPMTTENTTRRPTLASAICRPCNQGGVRNRRAKRANRLSDKPNRLSDKAASLNEKQMTLIRGRARGYGRLSSAAGNAGGDGLWRSLVAHLTGGQVVAGSNPVSPTTKSAGRGGFREIRSRFFPYPWEVWIATRIATRIMRIATAAQSVVMPS